MKSFLAFTLLVLSSVGCSAIIDPDQGLLGGGDGTVDGGPVLMLMDSGAGLDAGPGVDGGPVMSEDGGPPAECEPGPATCDGGVLVSCERGFIVRTTCAATGGFCDSSDGPTTCRPRVCVPNASRCDGETLRSCDAVGGEESAMTCPFGCTGAAPSASCVGMPMLCPGVERLTEGTHRFTTCGEGDDETYAPMTGCAARARANGEDVVFSFTLATSSRVTLDVRDADGSTGIDTILYVRTACGDVGSQTACADDVPCSSSDVIGGCMGSVQVRQSTLTTTLPAGTYYVVVDSFNYSVDGASFTCGFVSLTYTVGG